MTDTPIYYLLADDKLYFADTKKAFERIAAFQQAGEKSLAKKQLEKHCRLISSRTFFDSLAPSSRESSLCRAERLSIFETLSNAERQRLRAPFTTSVMHSTLPNFEEFASAAQLSDVALNLRQQTLEFYYTLESSILYPEEVERLLTSQSATENTASTTLVVEDDAAMRAKYAIPREFAYQLVFSAPFVTLSSETTLADAFQRGCINNLPSALDADIQLREDASTTLFRKSLLRTTNRAQQLLRRCDDLALVAYLLGTDNGREIFRLYSRKATTLDLRIGSPAHQRIVNEVRQIESMTALPRPLRQSSGNTSEPPSERISLSVSRSARCAV